MHIVQCTVLNREAEGLEKPPYPGELGERIYQNVSQEGWNQWLQRLVLIINENRLSTADPESVNLIEQHMLGFLFKEGDLGDVRLRDLARGKNKLHCRWPVIATPPPQFTHLSGSSVINSSLHLLHSFCESFKYSARNDGMTDIELRNTGYRGDSFDVFIMQAMARIHPQG